MENESLDHQPTQERERLQVGDRVTVDILGPAHGGHFIARHEGQVLFVRHAIPGERVVVEVTSVVSKVTRADVVDVLEPSAHRVSPPCEFSGAGGCGGCDFQHIEIGYQRELKAAIVTEQFARLGKIDLAELGLTCEVRGVEPTDGLHWRTRMDFAISDFGKIGFYKSRSKEVQEINDCLIAVEEMNVPALASKTWNGDARIEVATSSSGETNVSRGGRSLSGPTQLHEVVEGMTYTISPVTFWQAHRSAPASLVDHVMETLDVRPGDTVCDLYGGAGLFSGALAQAVGPKGKVHLIESDRRALSDAASIFKGYSNVQIHSGMVEQLLPKIEKADLVLLDPPRTGAGEVVVLSLLKLRPTSIVYVSCDPASLARDAKWITEGGYTMDSIVAFDLFPMTQHVETVVRFNLA
jgi:tRNA/tmRNA/rRNA uracil-C5-methylase (TrmA/RlmC/RlmD family)